MIGYDLISGLDGVSYGHGKSTLQMLRAGGVLKVTQDGPRNKAKWVAYQTFWFTPFAETWIDGIETQREALVDKRLADVHALVRRLGDTRKRVGEDWLRDPDKLLILKIAMGSGFVELHAIATEHGKATVAGVKLRSETHGG